MNNQPKVSIIVPIYNVEEYLVKCLDSLVNQTLKEIEIICINDGSTDNSLEILKAYAQKDDRITVINKKNSGVSDARNTGLEMANGEYVMFVDSDDYLEIQTCQSIYEKIKKDNSNLLIFNYFLVTQETKHRAKELDNILTDKFTFTQCPDNFFYINTGILGKLYKNSNLKRFDTKLKKGEDTVFFWLYCLENNPEISVLNIPLYNYKIRDNSTMSNQSYFQSAEVFNAIEVLTDSFYFKTASEYIQAKILDRWAKSLWYELKTLCDNIPTKYLYKTDCFFLMLKKYDRKDFCYIKMLKTQIHKFKYKKLIQIANKIFYVTNSDNHKVINLCGIKFKFKYYKKEQAKKENEFIKKISKFHKKYHKDSYLLFDALHDSTVECIDAFSLFEYMKSIGKKSYYVVLEDSELYKKLEQQGQLKNIISLKNSSMTNPGDFLEEVYPILLRCKAVISSFGANTTVTNNFFKNNPYWQYIFIQHGQIYLKESVLSNGYLTDEKFDKILISSGEEYKIFKKYNWDDRMFLKAGLPRWDLLKDNSKSERSILVMLTWRKLDLLTFENSLYKQNLNSLLNNNKLQKYLLDDNIKLYFAPHPALLHNQGINLDIRNKNVEIVDTDKISECIRKCSCLITDFSSVTFDFMFQNKPVLFYLLDKNEPNAHPQDKNDMAKFDYKKYILPNVCFEEDEVIEKIKYYVENNFELEPENKEKYNKFFYTKENIRQKLIEEIDKCCK